ncbi:Opsin-3 Encephalopsin Panopsin [Larimichthys crocea]|uniref:Opsin-3 Encephalopsin Panopsin n=1 Tax=Larimichthys crocea TaxID=215358 RepID=A0A6G0J5Y9_LARCR|nr:Opsin-3 Encephalopsin Panopsin [Larimichthys crocea]
MDSRMFSGQAGLNYSFNLSDERDLVDEPAGKGKLSPTGFAVLSVVLGFIMTFGFLNNFIVLLLFCKFKKLRTPVNMMLLNISVSDMLVCLFGTTLSFASSIRGKWLLGRSGCNWYGFINSCFAGFTFKHAANAAKILLFLKTKALTDSQTRRCPE